MLLVSGGSRKNKCIYGNNICSWFSYGAFTRDFKKAELIYIFK